MSKPDTTPYWEKLKDPRWQKKRLEVFERDGFTCRDCGCTDKTLHVHHCHYAKGGPWETPENLLMTLCDRCHKDRHFGEGALKSDFAIIVSTLTPSEMGDLFEAMQGYLFDTYSNKKQAKLIFTREAKTEVPVAK